MAGRPIEYNDLTAQRVLKALKTGSSRRAAAHAARISRTTLQNWLARGRNGEEPFVDFLVNVKEAEAKAEHEMLDVLWNEAKTGKWQPALEWLRRRRPMDWCEPKLVPANGTSTGTGEDNGSDDISVIESVLAAAKSRKAG